MRARETPIARQRYPIALRVGRRLQPPPAHKALQPRTPMTLAPVFTAFVMVASLACSKPPAEARPEPAAAPVEVTAPAEPAPPTPSPAAAPQATGVPTDFPPKY